MGMVSSPAELSSPPPITSSDPVGPEDDMVRTFARECPIVPFLADPYVQLNAAPAPGSEEDEGEALIGDDMAR